MAYMNQEKKAIIAKAVKAVLPTGWKVTFAVRNYSTIVCTVRSAPLYLEHAFNCEPGTTYKSINHYWLDKECNLKSLRSTLQNIISALNTDNHDNSDIMTDYFDVGHYIELRFGSWNKPFINTLDKA